MKNKYLLVAMLDEWNRSYLTSLLIITGSSGWQERNNMCINKGLLVVGVDKRRGIWKNRKEEIGMIRTNENPRNEKARIRRKSGQTNGGKKDRANNRK